MADNETIADIIAEMRFHGQLNIDAEQDKPEFGVLTVEGKITKSYADRLEAAHKRMEWTHKKELETRDAVIQTEVAGREAEREAHKRAIDKLMKTNAELAKLVDPEEMPPVNAAKLREALVLVQKKINYLIGKLTVPNSLVANRMEINGIINAALAAPPRNCDVYNNESCRMAYHLHGDGLMTMQAFADWLFAPAPEKEGGNDGNK